MSGSLRSNRLRPRARVAPIAALLLALLAVARPARADLPFDIKFYGFLNAEVEWARALGGTTPYTSRMRVADGQSRIGLAGSYDITDTTKASIQLEGYLNNFEQGGIDDLGNSSTLESRNSYIGIEDTRFGRLMVGYYDNAYRSLVGTGSDFGGNYRLTATGLDLWNNTSAALSGGFSSLFGRGEARLKNSIHYMSPEIFNLKLMASYGFDETLAQGGRRDHASVALLWAWSGLKIGVGWDHQANTGIDGDLLQRGYGFQTSAVNDVATNFYKGIISYEFPTHTYLGFGYERSVYGYSNFVLPVTGQVYTPLAEGYMSQGGAMASVAQSLFDDSLTLMLSVGKLGNLSNSIVGPGNDYGAKQLSVGAKYALNKYFMVYVYFTRIENESLQNLNLGAPIFSNAGGVTSPLSGNSSSNGTSAGNGAYLSPGDKPMAGGTGLVARF